MSDEAVPSVARAGLARRDLIHFLARRLHSLTGILPIGVFLANHLLENYQAVGVGGAERFDHVVVSLQRNPIIIWVEIFGIGVPLLYHAIYGLVVAREARFNTGAYGYGANVRFLFQRVTGVILVFYIGYHVWMTRLQPVVNPQAFAETQGLISYNYMRGYLTEPLLGIPTWIFYVVGILCACFHLANGLWGFLIHWGVTVGPRAQRLSAYACVAVGVILSALGLVSLAAFVVP